jgi:uncharacterized protein
MIDRHSESAALALLEEFPIVAILGPRQVGKTTLALALVNEISPKPLYLDLENPADQARLADARQYFDQHQNSLVVLDEIQHVPELFRVLRGVVDQRRREGKSSKQFLILGSASLELLQQSSESLAGRIAYTELTGIMADEIDPSGINSLWLRGGFPDSYLAKDDKASMRWRLSFIKTYLEREVPQFGYRIPASLLRRLWTMLAHSQGGQLNMSKLSSSLDVAVPTIKRYIDLLEDLLLVRLLKPWSSNAGKRLVKAPKVYIRDSGLAHALLSLDTIDDVWGHPVAGASWEAFAVENILASLPIGATAWYYRTAAGAEIDLVIEQGMKKRWAIEIKRSSAPTLSKGFYLGCDDIKATDKYLVYSGQEKFPLPLGITAISLRDMVSLFRNLS